MLGLHRFDVRVDDPDMDRAHDFTVTAQWPYMARLAAARRAILLEGAVRFPEGRPGLLARVRQACSRDIVRAVAEYTVERPRR